MKNNVLVSIIIPTFKQGPYIEKCLETIRGQSYPNFEVIIQDSMSPDETKSICEKYVQMDPRFIYVREKDSGQSDAINRGLKKSKGEYWTWICSDDFYANPDALKILVENMPDDQFAVGIFGKANYVDETGHYLSDYFCIERDAYRVDYKKVWPFSQPASLLKTQKVREVLGVNDQLHLGMDLDLFLKMLPNDSFYFKYVAAVIASVRTHNDSKTIALAKRTMVQALKLQFKYFGIGFSLRNSIYWKTLVQLFKDDLRSFLKRQIG